MRTISIKEKNILPINIINEILPNKVSLDGLPASSIIISFGRIIGKNKIDIMIKNIIIVSILFFISSPPFALLLYKDSLDLHL